MHSAIIKTASIILKIASAGFLIAACYHLLAIFIDLNNSTVWRNLLFISINLWCAIEVQKGKYYFTFLFTILFIQQLISHGGSVLNSHIDHIAWLDIFVLVSITLIYVAVLISAISFGRIKHDQANNLADD